jgi:hypothetical protein
MTTALIVPANFSAPAIVVAAAGERSQTRFLGILRPQHPQANRATQAQDK